jgi:hypothetical protein
VALGDARAQFRDSQPQRAQARFQPIPTSASLIRPIGAPLVAPGPAASLGLRFHQPLQFPRTQFPEKLPITVLLCELKKCHAVLALNYTTRGDTTLRPGKHGAQALEDPS